MVTDEDSTSVNACLETKPVQCYVYSTAEVSCMATSVDPLVVLNCSMWFPSTLFNSTLGSWKPFSDAGFELVMLPDTELTAIVFSGMLL